MTRRKGISGDVNICEVKKDEIARGTQRRVKGSVLQNYTLRRAGAEAVCFRSC